MHKLAGDASYRRDGGAEDVLVHAVVVAERGFCDVEREMRNFGAKRRRGEMLDFDDSFSIIGSRPRERPLDVGLFAQHSQTSTQAFARVQPKIRGQKATLYALILASGSHGITRKELSEATHFLRDSVNGRCRELVQAELIVERGVRSGEKVLYGR